MPSERSNTAPETAHPVEPRRPDEPAVGRYGVVRYDVAELLRGGREAVLEHNGADYHLRITANGRLILTK